MPTDRAAPHPHRRGFLKSLAAVAVVPLAGRAASSEHVHGLNGATLPLNKQINMTMRILDGPDFELQSQRGKVVVMNFFATWCPACLAETADLQAFSNRHAADTFLLGVDHRETDDTVRTFRRKYAITYPIAMDEKGIFYINIGLRVFPSTLFFRPDGTISCVYPGSLTPHALAQERWLAMGIAGDGTEGAADDASGAADGANAQPSPSASPL